MAHHHSAASRIMDSEHVNSVPNTSLFTSFAFRLTPCSFFLFPLWFACFWAIVGTVWRPPLTSVGLIVIFLVLIIGIEWATRRLTAKKLPLDTLPSQNMLAESPLDESVQQQIIRSKTAAGVDRFDGTFVAEFPANAMTATVHIPFCPAFDRLPKVQVFPTDENDTALRITSLKPFGLRVDVKRNHLTYDHMHFIVIAEG